MLRNWASKRRSNQALFEAQGSNFIFYPGPKKRGILVNGTERSRILEIYGAYSVALKRQALLATFISYFGATILIAVFAAMQRQWVGEHYGLFIKLALLAFFFSFIIPGLILSSISKNKAQADIRLLIANRHSSFPPRGYKKSIKARYTNLSWLFPIALLSISMIGYLLSFKIISLPGESRSAKMIGDLVSYRDSYRFIISSFWLLLGLLALRWKLKSFRHLPLEAEV